MMALSMILKNLSYICSYAFSYYGRVDFSFEVLDVFASNVDIDLISWHFIHIYYEFVDFTDKQIKLHYFVGCLLALYFLFDIFNCSRTLLLVTVNFYLLFNHMYSVKLFSILTTEEEKG